ncbi:hypothetical protein EXIGLDRAFT_731964 [Exidia glandulosa HHB12029]|uniref:Zn(2)-C6 fungal-type domain-containing protein n=1 Tax=Exidia glandulosa HHB12029 TaxID=1314781 RepID=A0A165BP80_EXIGL|nr:hypothetical protein EXIGLDRAFT_731964 [Exidia glandulosa HHB12029]
MRCDGGKPACQNCTNRKLECDYPDQTRTRGPTKSKPPPAQPTIAPAPMPYHPTDGLVYYHQGMDPSMMQPIHPPPSVPRHRAKRSASEMEGDQDAEGEDDPSMQTPTSSKKRNTMRGGKRAQMACHSCRARKMKCDEQQPACSQCARRHLPCAYDDTVRRRGPSKKASKRGEDDEDGQQQPQHHQALHLMPVTMNLPGAGGDSQPKYMALIGPDGVPVQILGIDPTSGQMLPVGGPPPGMVMTHAQPSHAQSHEEQNGHDQHSASPHEQSPHGDDGDAIEGHPPQQPVIWS